ncbi:HAD family hydrolase [Mangrovimicrobium sediminis]|uniref:HAD family hydrolase n=1 Tax=Mangrovimicrobium sediminis TaxID=2562682 RepID=A0A4Z0M1W7_9GAMM|nr:HAD family hydrolase [Haliea sp. SAOS-164]
MLFDLDGTLVDTAEEFVGVVQALRAEHGMDAMDPQRIRASVSNGARALVALGLGIEESAPEFEGKRLRLLELYGEVLGSAARPYPGLLDLLAALAERGIAWGVSTNKPRAYAEPLLQRIDLPPCPSLVCPDDVRERKPHPESLYRNCRDLGCAPHEAIYVGDHLRDIEAGRRAGMFTIAAAYGYIEPHDDPHSWGADALVEHSTDLAALLLDC